MKDKALDVMQQLSKEAMNMMTQMAEHAEDMQKGDMGKWPRSTFNNFAYFYDMWWL